MGYTIVIGEQISDDSVDITEDLNAPAFVGDEATHNTNVRKPTYAGWDDFIKNVDLYELFMNDETGLMKKHPDIVAITEEHFQSVNESYLLFTAVEENQTTDDNIKVSYSLNYARLKWLRFWFRWALDNCENPAIWNY